MWKTPNKTKKLKQSIFRDSWSEMWTIQRKQRPNISGFSVLSTFHLQESHFLYDFFIFHISLQRVPIRFLLFSTFHLR